MKDYDRLEDHMKYYLNILRKDTDLISGDIQTRIKTCSSLKAKCEKKGITAEEINDKIGDIVGCRVICKYFDEIPKLVSEIKLIPGLTIVRIKDYIANPKKNGYQAYHLLCKVSLSTREGNKLLSTEIQIRTKGQDNWATIEHEIRYKPEEDNENIDDEKLDSLLTKLAQACAAVDLLNMQIRDYYNSTKNPAE